MWVDIQDTYGKPIISCDSERLQQVFLETLLRRYDKIFIKLALRPEKKALELAELPFSEQPKICSIGKSSGSKYSVCLDIEVELRDGSESFLIDLECDLELKSLRRALRSSIQKRIPLTENHLKNLQDWFEEFGEPLLEDMRSGVDSE